MILNFYFGFNWNAIEKFGCSAESGAQTKVRVGLTRIAPCCSSVLNLMMKAISPEFLINLRPDTTLAVSARSLNVVRWSAIEMFSQLTPNKIVISAKVWILKNAGWSIEWLEHLEGWGAWPEPWIGVNGPGGPGEVVTHGLVTSDQPRPREDGIKDLVCSPAQLRICFVHFCCESNNCHPISGVAQAQAGPKSHTCDIVHFMIVEWRLRRFDVDNNCIY